MLFYSVDAQAPKYCAFSRYNNKNNNNNKKTRIPYVQLGIQCADTAKITQAFHVNRTYTAICHTKDPGWAETHNERILRTLGKCRHNTHAVSD